MVSDHRGPRLDQQHLPRYAGVMPCQPTCTCGWVGGWARSRGEAFRAWQGHTWLVSRRATQSFRPDDPAPHYSPRRR